jgi:hypothetical protein
VSLSTLILAASFNLDGRLLTNALDLAWSDQLPAKPAEDTSQIRRSVEFSAAGEGAVRQRLQDLEGLR